MLIAERQSRLRELLARRGMGDLDSLSAELQVSQSTVRRDIEMLEQGGLVERTHGGVIWVGEKRDGARPYAFDQRMNYQLDAKQQIARAARPLVQPGQTILIDGGTTTFYLARELLGQPLQLVTNSLPIANLFLNDEQRRAGPHRRAGLPALRRAARPDGRDRPWPASTPRRCSSAPPASTKGSLYNQNSLLVQAEQRMMQQVQKVVLLADSSKFGQQALSALCRLDEIDMVVTDAGLSPEHREAVSRCGVRIDHRG